MRTKLSLLFISGALVVLLALSSSVSAQVSRDVPGYGGVVPRNAQYAGLTYGEWANKWQQWATLLPATNHPLMDTSNCSAGQSGPVWFLGGLFCANGAVCDFTAVKRACTIPAGKALFFPIMNGEDSFIEEYTGKTEAEIRALVKQGQNWNTNMSASVDGLPIRKLESFRICSLATTCLPSEAPLFSYRLASHDNLYATIGEHLNITGPLMPDDLATEGITDGIYILLKPLDPGMHTIHFHGESGLFVMDVSYVMNVLK